MLHFNTRTHTSESAGCADIDVLKLISAFTAAFAAMCTLTQMHIQNPDRKQFLSGTLRSINSTLIKSSQTNAFRPLSHIWIIYKKNSVNSFMCQLLFYILLSIYPAADMLFQGIYHLMTVRMQFHCAQSTG